MQVTELPSPYGDCEPSENYTQSDCLAECEAKYVITNCSCKDIYMPGESAGWSSNVSPETEKFTSLSNIGPASDVKLSA